MNRRVVFHPSAEEETIHAVEWYAERSAIAARAFIDELNRMVRLARDFPEAWPLSFGDTRRIVFTTFPFDRVFRVKNEIIETLPSLMSGAGLHTG
jgi:plasmid stabilization system protein ParE